MRHCARPIGRCDTYLWRLGGDLDTILQYGDGKIGMRAGAEPQSEVGVHAAVLELLDHLIQLGHPGEREVAVGQEHPAAVPLTHLQQTETARTGPTASATDRHEHVIYTYEDIIHMKT